MTNLVHAEKRQIEQPKKRRTWLEKHGELIAKLQNDFQLPEVADQSTTSTRYHTFTIGSLKFLISNTLSPEILEETKIHPLLLTPPWVLGTCNVRGDIISVFDLNKVFDQEANLLKASKPRVLVINEQDYTLGLRLDELPTPIDLKHEEQIRNFSNLPDSITTFVKAAYKRGDDIWLQINFSSLFLSLEN